MPAKPISTVNHQEIKKADAWKKLEPEKLAPMPSNAEVEGFPTVFFEFKCLADDWL